MELHSVITSPIGHVQNVYGRSNSVSDKDALLKGIRHPYITRPQARDFFSHNWLFNKGLAVLYVLGNNRFLQRHLHSIRMIL